jgi:hypothetical protein
MSAATIQPGPHAWRTLRWTSLAVFMALLDATILFVAFPSLRRSFPSVSAADLSWVLNATPSSTRPFSCRLGASPTDSASRASRIDPEPAERPGRTGCSS